MNIADELDRLYQIPLSEFIAARNKLAASVKKIDGADAAKSIKALPKPNASAWAVNQVYWQERWVFDALIAASDRLRSGIESGAVDAAAREREETVAVAIGRARRFLEQNGERASDVVLRRVTTTFDTLASYGSSNPNPMRGRLSEDLQPAGFGAFAGVAPQVPPPPSAPPPPPEPSEQTPSADPLVDDAAAQLQAALDEVARLESGLEADRAAHAQATQKVAALRQELGALKRRLLDAETAAQLAGENVASRQEALEAARAKTTN